MYIKNINFNYLMELSLREIKIFSRINMINQNFLKLTNWTKKLYNWKKLIGIKKYMVIL